MLEAYQKARRVHNQEPYAGPEDRGASIMEGRWPEVEIKDKLVLSFSMLPILMI
jgi:hypothetical protein